MEYEELKYFVDLNKKGIKTNDLKDKIQDAIITKWLNPKLEFKGIGFMQAFTGFGKTYIASKIFKRYRAKFSDNIVVIVPNTNLYNDFVQIGKELGLENYYVYIINTYVMSEDESIVRDCGLCFMDELHRMCSEMSEYFQKAIPMTRFKYFLGVSATLEKKHIEFLEVYNIKEVFTITVAEGMKLEIIPEYSVYNVGVDLTPKEKYDFYKHDKVFKSAFELFKIGGGWDEFDLMMACSMAKGFKSKVNRSIGESNTTEEATSEMWCMLVGENIDSLQGLSNYEIVSRIKSKAFIARNAMQDREKIINNSENKKFAVLDILKVIDKRNESKDEKDYSITFMNSIDRVTEIEQSCGNIGFSYHSKLGTKTKKDRLNKYRQGVFYHLLTIKSLDEGFSERKASIALYEAYSSKVRQTVQRFGRVIRLDEKNPEKKPIAIFLYCNPFIIEDVEAEILPNDYKKLHSIQKELLNINYINMEKCLEILKRR